MHRSRKTHREAEAQHHHSPLLQGDRNEYRHKLYTRLRKKCEPVSACFLMTGPISQIQDERNDEFGHCHGYNEVFTAMLMHGTAKTFLENRPAWDWDTLAGQNSYQLDFFPINDEIHQEQQHQQRLFGFIQHWHAHAYHDQKELVHSLINETLLKDAFEIGKLYVINIGTIPSRSLSPARILLEHAPSLKSHWHEILLYVDEAQHVCLLDANIGLFKSREPAPSAEALQTGLEDIFHAVGYSRYRILDVTKRLTIDFHLEKSLKSVWNIL